VTRRIIELRAVVEPGDSGGPLLLFDGTVGGVVFAESRSDENVGYALSPTAVAVAVQPAIGLTRPVDLGPCLR
jgi:S1-C subfamily serine protease